jgi:hypothetical protein|tara:strand:- start:268 stop:642 length:375 start_codon:yes stop_codon:yes gene_type:complete
MRTPWGQSDHEEQEKPGITWVGTPSHGGYHLDRARQAAVKAKFPWFTSWAGGPWYEEDCDWCVVVLVFADEYQGAKDCEGSSILAAAIQTAEIQAKHDRDGDTGQWRRLKRWLDAEQAQNNLFH